MESILLDFSKLKKQESTRNYDIKEEFEEEIFSIITNLSLENLNLLDDSLLVQRINEYYSLYFSSNIFSELIDYFTENPLQENNKEYYEEIFQTLLLKNLSVINLDDFVEIIKKLINKKIFQGVLTNISLSLKAVNLQSFSELKKIFMYELLSNSSYKQLDSLLNDNIASLNKNEIESLSSINDSKSLSIFKHIIKSDKLTICDEIESHIIDFSGDYEKILTKIYDYFICDSNLELKNNKVSVCSIISDLLQKFNRKKNSLAVSIIINIFTEILNKRPLLVFNKYSLNSCNNLILFIYDTKILKDKHFLEFIHNILVMLCTINNINKLCSLQNKLGKNILDIIIECLALEKVGLESYFNEFSELFSNHISKYKLNAIILDLPISKIDILEKYIQELINYLAYCKECLMMLEFLG